MRELSNYLIQKMKVVNKCKKLKNAQIVVLKD